MITLASVDLPEPLGPIRAWTRPFSTSRSRPLRICFSSILTCRLRISSSAISLRFWGLAGSWALQGVDDRGGLGANLGFAVSLRRGKIDQLGQRGAGEALGDTVLRPGPEQLGRAAAVAVAFVRTEDPALGGLVEALHRRDLPFQRLD